MDTIWTTFGELRTWSNLGISEMLSDNQTPCSLASISESSDDDIITEVRYDNFNAPNFDEDPIWSTLEIFY